MVKTASGEAGPTEAGVVAELTAAAMTPHVVEAPGGRKFLVRPADTVIAEISDPHGLVTQKPHHIKQAVVVQTVDSLVDYTNRFKGDGTALFADIDKNAIEARLDYHQPTATDHNEHLARMVLPYSVEWATWTAADKKLVSQLEFARFLEENGGDIVAPNAADVLEACRDLQAVRKADFKKAVRTSSDNENFEYTNETNLTNKGVEVPSKFKLMIPVYFGEPPTEIHAFLRWKLVDGQLCLGVALHRAEHVRQAVFQQIVLAAAERTARPAVFGRLGS